MDLEKKTKRQNQVSFTVKHAHPCCSKKKNKKKDLIIKISLEFDQFHVTSLVPYPGIISSFFNSYTANIYLFKVINRNTRRCKICSKLTIKILDVTDVVVLVSLLQTLNIFHTFF